MLNQKKLTPRSFTAQPRVVILERSEESRGALRSRMTRRDIINLIRLQFFELYIYYIIYKFDFLAVNFKKYCISCTFVIQ